MHSDGAITLYAQAVQTKEKISGDWERAKAGLQAHLPGGGR